MAIFTAYSPVSSSTSFVYATEFYRVLTAGVGYAEGDILRRKAQINESTGVVTGIENWYNVDQDAVIAAPTGTDIEALDGYREKLASETLVVDATVGGVTLASIPANANHAEFHILDADIVFTIDGATVPVGLPTPLGIRQADRQNVELEGRDELVNFTAIRLDATDARIYVEYSRVFSVENS